MLLPGMKTREGFEWAAIDKADVNGSSHPWNNQIGGLFSGLSLTIFLFLDHTHTRFSSFDGEYLLRLFALENEADETLIICGTMPCREVEDKRAYWTTTTILVINPRKRKTMSFGRNWKP